MTDPVERFAEEAALFQHWALHGRDTGESAAREALIRITRLYLAALELPPASSVELADQSNAPRVGRDEHEAVFAAAARLPLQFYAEVFDPLPIPAQEPVLGHLADDIADIYGHVVEGLLAYRADDRARAVWEWGFGLQHHWGEHATGAIRALHSWLAANAPNCLAAGP
jgi:hypothetical protein